MSEQPRRIGQTGLKIKIVNPTQRGRAPGIRSEQWAHYEHLISLMVELKWPVEEMLATLALLNFYPNVRQLGDRIREWAFPRRQGLPSDVGLVFCRSLTRQEAVICQAAWAQRTHLYDREDSPVWLCAEQILRRYAANSVHAADLVHQSTYYLLSYAVVNFEDCMLCHLLNFVVPHENRTSTQNTPSNEDIGLVSGASSPTDQSTTLLYPTEFEEAINLESDTGTDVASTTEEAAFRPLQLSSSVSLIGSSLDPTPGSMSQTVPAKQAPHDYDDRPLSQVPALPVARSVYSENSTESSRFRNDAEAIKKSRMTRFELLEITSVSGTSHSSWNFHRVTGFSKRSIRTIDEDQREGTTRPQSRDTSDIGWPTKSSTSEGAPLKHRNATFEADDEFNTNHVALSGMGGWRQDADHPVQTHESDQLRAYNWRVGSSNQDLLGIEEMDWIAENVGMNA